MIDCFEVLAAAGSSSPRAMASGVARATIPTMAGMVVALSGLLAVARIDRVVRRESEGIAERLVI